MDKPRLDYNTLGYSTLNYIRLDKNATGYTKPAAYLGGQASGMVTPGSRVEGSANWATKGIFLNEKFNFFRSTNFKLLIRI